jgi:hypothetical protein
MIFGDNRLSYPIDAISHRKEFLTNAVFSQARARTADNLSRAVYFHGGASYTICFSYGRESRYGVRPERDFLYAGGQNLLRRQKNSI